MNLCYLIIAFFLSRKQLCAKAANEDNEICSEWTKTVDLKDTKMLFFTCFVFHVTSHLSWTVRIKILTCAALRLLFFCLHWSKESAMALLVLLLVVAHFQIFRTLRSIPCYFILKTNTSTNTNYSGSSVCWLANLFSSMFFCQTETEF